MAQAFAEFLSAPLLPLFALAVVHCRFFAPAAPTAAQMAATKISPELTAVLDKVVLGEEFRKWLLSQDIVECEDFAMMASDEAKVEENIVKKVDQSVPKIKEIGTLVKITKVWKLCRIGR